MPVLAIAGLKGGVGKSTVAVCLASELHRRGDTVLLCDADPQRSALTWAAAAAEAEQPCPTTVAIHTGFHRPGQIPSAGYVWTLIDTPPQDGGALRSAMMIADLLVMPLQPGPFDAWRAADAVELLREAQTMRPELRAVVALNRTARNALTGSARDALKELGLPILTTALGNRVTYPESIAAGTGPTVYAPKSPAALEVKSLTDEIVALLPTAKPAKRSRSRG